MGLLHKGSCLHIETDKELIYLSTTETSDPTMQTLDVWCIFEAGPRWVDDRLAKLATRAAHAILGGGR